MRLVDADALTKMLDRHKKDCNPEHFDGHETFIEKIDAHDSYGEWQFANGFNLGVVASIVDTKNAPTIDAVKVVRCGECKYYLNSNEKCGLVDTRLLFYETDKVWAEDSFCSWGERKEDVFN